MALVEHGTFGGTCLNVGCIPTKMFVLPRRRRARGRAPATGSASTPPSTRCAGPTSATACSAASTRSRAAGATTARTGAATSPLYEGHARFTGPQRSSHVGDRRRRSPPTASCSPPGSRPGVPDGRRRPGVAVPHLRHRHADRRAARAPGDPRRRATSPRSSRTSSPRSASRSPVVGAASRCCAARTRPCPSGSPRSPGDRWDVHLDARCRRARPATAARSPSTWPTARPCAATCCSSPRPHPERRPARPAGRPASPRPRRRRVVVDELPAHPADGVFALGDVSSAVPAQARREPRGEGRRAQPAAPREPRAPTTGSCRRAVFTHPQIAAVGRTEQECRAGTALDYAVQVQAYGDVAYGWAMEDTTGFCKVLADRGTGRLLGAHIMGPQALDADPAADPGHVVRADGARDGPRAVLDPPGADRARRERPARPAAL